MSDNDYDKATEIKDLLNEYKKFTKKYESIIEDGSEIVKRLNDIGEGNLAIRMKSYLIQRMQSFINGFEMFQISEVNEALKELIEEEEE